MFLGISFTYWIARDLLIQRQFTSNPTAISLGQIVSSSKIYDGKYRPTTQLEYRFQSQENGKEYFGKVACWSNISGPACPPESVDFAHNTIRIQYLQNNPSMHRVYNELSEDEAQKNLLVQGGIAFVVILVSLISAVIFIKNLRAALQE
jgi:hypothetical protein